MLLAYEGITRANPLQAPHAGLWASCIIAAALVGALFDQFRHRQHELENDLARDRQQLATVQGQNEVLEAAVSELRGRILGAGETFGSLYEVARRLTTLSPEQLYRACLELSCRQTEASDAHFFLVVADGLEAVAHHPNSASPRTDPHHSRLIRRALDTGKLANAYELADLAEPNDPLVVVPLLNEQGEVVAVLTFENLPFRRFHPSTLAELESIADWTGRAMAQVQRFSQGEQRLAVGQVAQQKLLNKLSQVALQEAELPLLEALVEPMQELLATALLDENSGGLLRSNLLLLMRSHPADPATLARFVKQEMAWVRLACRDLQGLTHQSQGPALRLLLIYLQRNLARRRQHLLQAQALLRSLPADTLEELLTLPLARPQGRLLSSLGQSVEGWAGREFCETLEATVALGPKEAGHITLEEQLLDFLGRPDEYLVCATLHCLGKLNQPVDLTPGTPVSVAVELAQSPSPRIREAARCCLLASGISTF